MPKRKSTHAETAATEEPSRRRSLRRQKIDGDDEAVLAPTPKVGKTKQKPAEKKKATVKEEIDDQSEEAEQSDEPPAKRGRPAKQHAKKTGSSPPPAKKAAAKPSAKSKTTAKTNGTTSDSSAPASNAATSTEGKNYWLLKAEPETRYENGIDVKFSIDDLAAKTEPEPWDGIRNYAARNNLRAMKKGDLAFFYHSNCKEPGIAGTMEIVQEHSPDLSAHDPKAPYYDANSKPSDPKWSVVHVKFRSKFAVPIGLKELKELGTPGKPLENMQMIKQSRLSVSKVSAVEWEYLNKIAEEKARKV